MEHCVLWWVGCEEGNNDADKIHKVAKHGKNLVVWNILRIEFSGMSIRIISGSKCRLRGYCVLLGRYCVLLGRYCVLLGRYCVLLGRYCVLLRGYCTELCSARCAENRTVVKLCVTIWTYFHIFFSFINSSHRLNFRQNILFCFNAKYYNIMKNICQLIFAIIVVFEATKLT